MLLDFFLPFLCSFHHALPSFLLSCESLWHHGIKSTIERRTNPREEPWNNPSSTTTTRPPPWTTSAASFVSSSSSSIKMPMPQTIRARMMTNPRERLPPSGRAPLQNDPPRHHHHPPREISSFVPRTTTREDERRLISTHPPGTFSIGLDGIVVTYRETDRQIDRERERCICICIYVYL